MTSQSLALGLDFGTSGARAAVLDQNNVRYLGEAPYPQDDRPWSDRWVATLHRLIQQIPPELRLHIQQLAIDGTSGTVLLCDPSGSPLADPLFYNDDRSRQEAQQLQSIAPAGSPVLSPTSSLSKLLWWQANLPPFVWHQAHYLIHQADWLAYQLHRRPGLSDYHNALKLGYDVEQLQYPDWIPDSLRRLLPQVLAPGSRVAPIHPEAASLFGLPTTCHIHAGTTDSIAAFLASGADQPGMAVTSLGSTLVLKLLSPVPVYDSRYGIYSHRLNSLWLVGGASNSGGAVLKQYFSGSELRSLSQQIDPSQSSGLDYYPLSQPGERFPINDPELPPRLTPRPACDAQFLHGLLEGIARIEQQGYTRLAELGAPRVQRVYTAGGGAQNSVWITLRQRLLGCPVEKAAITDAAVGAARLTRFPGAES
ncbi:carbohydrate kinase [filamentous cyanobacterium CCP5]|nr:carbohydrate kinase [filamentous cyanobacterium CCP5]